MSNAATETAAELLLRYCMRLGISHVSPTC